MLNREPGRANGTPYTTTPWAGHFRRRRSIVRTRTRPEKSRCRHTDSAQRVSYQAIVEYAQCGQSRRLRALNATRNTVKGQVPVRAGGVVSDDRVV